MIRLVVKGQPPPKPRPRVTRTGTYTPRPKNDNGLMWQLKLACRRPLTGDIELRLLFFRATKRAVDIDNLIKFVMDEANGIVWRDDSQVKEVRATLTLGSLYPRTEIEISERSRIPQGGTNGQDTTAL